MVGLCNFPFEAPYVQLHTLCMGLLFQLIQHPDIANLLGAMSIARPILAAMHDPISTPYLKVLTGGLMFQLSKAPEQLAKLKEEYGERGELPGTMGQGRRG